MALREERIVEFVVLKFKERLLRIKTKNALETFLNNLTKTRVKTFIKDALEEEATRREEHSADEATTATDIRAIKDYVDTL